MTTATTTTTAMVLVSNYGSFMEKKRNKFGIKKYTHTYPNIYAAIRVYKNKYEVMEVLSNNCQRNIKNRYKICVCV